MNEYYPSERDYIFALAEALRSEYQRVYDAWLLLQVDDAVLANVFEFLVQQRPERYREWAELRIEALNHALRGIPEDRIRHHACFGSRHAPRVAMLRCLRLLGQSCAYGRQPIRSRQLIPGMSVNGACGRK